MGVARNFFFISILVTLLCAVGLWATWQWLSVEFIPNRINDARLLDGRSFDYVIVGAGTAGCVLANRLSSNPNVTVLLVEAGSDFNAASIVPLASTSLQGTKYDWAFRTTPQKYSSSGLINNQQFLPRGKGLGGSGQINYMLHFTGVEQDFTRWEHLGALDWSWRAMRPYLDRLNEIPQNLDAHCDRTLQEPEELFDTTSHLMASVTETDDNSVLEFCQRKINGNVPPKDSSLHVTAVDATESLLAGTFVEASNELGNTTHDYKPARYTIRQGIRWSSYHAYLRPSFGRENLQILTSSTVEKIIFNEQKRVQGILVSTSDTEKPVSIRVTNEIILSAGAFQTPQLLKISGIGPRLELKRHQIELVHDSPHVGRNYFDHLNLPLFVSINVSASVTLNKILSPQTISDYLLRGSGVLSTTAVAAIGGIKGGKHGIILFGMGSVDEDALRHVSNMQRDTFRAYFPMHHNASQEGFLFLSTCHQPKSRGAIFLRSKRISDAPFINPNYLKHHADIDCMTDAIRLAAKTVDTSAFKQIGAKLHWPRVKACSNFGPFEEDLHTNQPNSRYLECILRVSALTGHHPGGTAAIGLGDDAVVDNELRVNGVHGLRVVDASVFPAPVSGTPNSVVIALAERASHIIMKSNSNQGRELS